MHEFLSFQDEDLDSTLRDGELPAAVRAAAESVIVIWTQDWCPQWTDLKSWILEEAGDIPVFVLVYNRHPRFEELMRFKEEVWGNREIPYVRHYREGALVAAHNWLPRATFREQLRRLAAAP